ncbi:hypothetical protein LAWI1_G007800 [Lachnellula willkommii]|uniref:Protein kinase domain-containing protein n=1 Tax=Lachnellula willkommii TaxID=215461 RepID=A0A559M069_9HELO|nr:hypothetical protein LAWI1_G007800 [Lachnellula willkommii]
MDDNDVQRALKVVHSVALSPPEHKLLSYFVLNSVDPKATALYVIQRASGGSESEMDRDVDLGIRRLLADWKELVGRFRSCHDISPSMKLLAWTRDGGRCCITKRSRVWWDMLGWTRILVLKLVPSQLVQGLDDEAHSSLRETLAVFLTEASLQRLIRCLDAESNHNGQIKNLWTLDKSAATAFMNGQIYLEPEWNAPEDSDNSCQQTSYYMLQNTLPPPFPILTNDKGLPIYSDVTLSTNSPKTMSLPSAFLFSVHARFCNSLRRLQVQDQILRGWPENSMRHKILAIPREIVNRVPFSLRKVWLCFPKAIRTVAYRLLLYLGLKMYGRPLAWVQRVPFGLYIKHGPGKFVTDGEGPALDLVEKHTKVSAPRLIEVLHNIDHTYLVMTRLPGVPLETAIHFMSYPERTHLAADLHNFICQLRSIPNPNTTAICSANGGPVFDYRLLGGVKSAGPFQSEEDFNIYIETAACLKTATHDLSHQIYFTHADLNMNNILISAGKLSGIVDFGCAGFYPEYWEYTKGVYVNFGPDSAWLDILSQSFSESYLEELKAERKLWEVTPPW